jgi:hypothetical protein
MMEENKAIKLFTNREDASRSAAALKATGHPGAFVVARPRIEHDLHYIRFAVECGTGLYLCEDGKVRAT